MEASVGVGKEKRVDQRTGPKPGRLLGGSLVTFFEVNRHFGDERQGRDVDPTLFGDWSFVDSEFGRTVESTPRGS